MMQRWWMHFPLCPWGWRQGVAPATALHISGTWRGNPPFVIVALTMAITIAIAVAISVTAADSVAIPVVAAHCCGPQPFAVVVAVNHRRRPLCCVAINHRHCRCPCCWPLPSPSPSAIPVAISIGHHRCHRRWPFPRVLPWCGKNCIQPIEAKLAASGGSCRQQGGSRVEMLTDHGRCCFFVLLGYQLLTDGVCDDVLGVVEGIAGETVIELTWKERGLKRYMIQKRKCIHKKESERCDTSGY